MASSRLRRTRSIAAVLTLMLGAALAVHAQPADPTVPTSQPTTRQTAYDRLLGNTADIDRVDRPIAPVSPQQMTDSSTGANAIAPAAPQLSTRREGSFLERTIGRLTKSNDAGGGWELTIESDGQALQDPPLKLLPNLKLMAMEQQRETLNRDVRFRVSGTITEYRGRNYLLVEEVVVVRDPP